MFNFCLWVDVALVVFLKKHVDTQLLLKTIGFQHLSGVSTLPLSAYFPSTLSQPGDVGSTKLPNLGRMATWRSAPRLEIVGLNDLHFVWYGWVRCQVTMRR